MTDITWTNWYSPADQRKAVQSSLTPTHDFDVDYQKAWDAFADTLDSFRDLPSDWDGLGADAPSQDVIDCAADVLWLWRERDFGAPPVRVIASPQGSVVLEWQNEQADRLEAEIREPGLIEYCYVRQGAEPEFSEESLNEGDGWENLWEPMSLGVITEAA